MAKQELIDRTRTLRKNGKVYEIRLMSDGIQRREWLSQDGKPLGVVYSYKWSGEVNASTLAGARRKLEDHDNGLAKLSKPSRFTVLRDWLIAVSNSEPVDSNNVPGL